MFRVDCKVKCMIFLYIGRAERKWSAFHRCPVELLVIDKDINSMPLVVNPDFNPRLRKLIGHEPIAPACEETSLNLFADKREMQSCRNPNRLAQLVQLKRRDSHAKTRSRADESGGHQCDLRLPGRRAHFCRASYSATHMVGTRTRDQSDSDFSGDLIHIAAGISAAHYAKWFWHRVCTLNNRKEFFSTTEASEVSMDFDYGGYSLQRSPSRF